MTVTTTEPNLSEPPSDAAQAAEAPAPALGMTRSRWVAAICGAAAVGLMATVLVLAKQTRDAPAAPGAGPARPLSDIDKFGTPTRAGARAHDFSGCGQLDPDKPPGVEFDLEGGKLAMGELKQGVKIEREVVFRSTGEGPLCVVNVSTGCGCLKAKLVGDKKRYEPGEEGKIHVLLDTTGRIGRIRKKVTLTTNSAIAPRQSFRVELEVDAGLIAEPRYLQFGNVTPSTAVTKTLILRAPKSDSAWELLGVEGGREIPGRGVTAYTYEVEPVRDPKYHMLKVHITHPGYEQVGPLRDTLRLTTTHPERPVIEVSGYINVTARIVSRSRVVSLGFIRPGVPRPPMRVRIQAGVPGVTFEIVGVEVLPPEGRPVPSGGVGFTATSGKDARGWWADVKYDGKARKAGLIEALLVVRTDDAEQPEVRVPIRATIRAAKK